MSTSIITKNNQSWTKYEQFEKCGEIKTSADGQNFGLNCIFCEIICLQLDTFVQHIQVTHTTAVQALFPIKREKKTPLVSGELMALDEIKVEPECIIGEPYLEDSTNDPFAEEELKDFDTADLKDDADFKPSNESDTDTDSSESDREQSNNIDLLANKNRNALTFVLDSYKSQPMLWDTNYLKNTPSKTARIYEKSWILLELSNDLLEKFKVDIEGRSIRSQFSKLRKLYRRESIKLSKSSNQNNFVPSLWCYENLEFLKDRKTNKKDKCPAELVPTERICEIVSIYRKHPCLWNINHKMYCEKSRKNESLQNMLEEIKQKLNMDLTLKQLDDRLRSLKYIYATYKRKRIQAETTFESTSKYYKILGFLENSIGPFKCEKCSQFINTHDKYKIHLAAHDGVKPFDCKICNKGFTQPGYLLMHMRQHSSEPLPKLLCDLCGEAYKTKSALKTHKEKHHLKIFNFECTICSKKFRQKYSYREHMNSHLNIRSCICDICGKGFFANKTLLQHKKIHAEKKTFSCHICGNNYPRSDSLNNHIKTKHTFKTFKAEVD